MLPETKDAIVLRVDFSNNEAWESIKLAIVKPVGEFQAYVNFVSDPDFNGVDLKELLAMQVESPYRSFMFVVDQTTLSHPGRPILVIDLVTEPGHSFRVIPSEMWGVENNLSIGNIDFAEFANHADSDGIFRGFSEV